MNAEWIYAKCQRNEWPEGMKVCLYRENEWESDFKEEK